MNTINLGREMFTLRLTLLSALILALASSVGAQEREWRIVQGPPSVNSLSSVCFTSTGIGFAVGESGAILKTIDTGSTWVKISHSLTTQHLRSVSFANASVGVVVGDGGVVLRTNDGGSSWSLISHGLTTNRLNSVSFANTSIGVIVGDGEGVINTILRTTNGGLSWSMLSPSVPKNYWWSVSFSNPMVGVVVGAGAAIRTTDGGVSWSSITFAEVDYFRSVSFTSNEVGVLVGYNGQIQRTIDGGASWARISKGVTSTYLYSISFASANIGVIVGRGVILRSIDAGASWSLISKSLTTLDLLSVSFADASRGIVVGGALSGPSLILKNDSIVVPTLSSPKNGEGDVATSPTLAWSPSIGSMSYDLQISLKADFSSLIVNDSGIVDTNKSVVGPLEMDTIYFWRTRAKQSTGYSKWSTTSKFTTHLDIPKAVILSTPSDKDTVRASSATLVWKTATPKVTRYNLEVSPDSLFKFQVTAFNSLTDTSHTVSLLVDKSKYWWRVLALNSAGAGPQPAPASFTVDLTQAEVKKKRNGLEWTLTEAEGNLRYTIPVRSRIHISLFNPAGRMIIIFEGSQERGSHLLKLPVVGASRRGYLLEFQAGKFTQRLLLSN